MLGNSKWGLEAQWFAGSLPFGGATGRGVRIKLILRTVGDSLEEDNEGKLRMLLQIQVQSDSLLCLTLVRTLEGAGALLSRLQSLSNPG